MVGDLWMRNSMNLQLYMVIVDFEGIETTLLNGTTHTDVMCYIDT